MFPRWSKQRQVYMLVDCVSTSGNKSFLTLSTSGLGVVSMNMSGEDGSD